MKSKIAFVTGATGFIGSHLVERLLLEGFAVKCLIRDKFKLGFLQNLPIEIIEGDLFNLTAIRNGVKNANYIFHVGGIVAGKSKKDFYRGNVEATKNLIDATFENKKNIRRFVFVSSLAVVGPSKNNFPVDEKSELNPITTYGKSKLEAEKIVLSFKDELPITIIRPSAVYGARDSATFDFFKSINKGILPLNNFGRSFINLIHVSDLINGILLSAKSENAIGKIYIIGSEKSYTWFEIGNICEEVLEKKLFKINLPKIIIFIYAGFVQFISLFKQKPSVINFEKAKDITAKYWICSVNKAKNEIGFSEKTTLFNGFKSTIDWYKLNNWF